ncbi:hypothetical protein V1514DRAFT_320618 [Lipomyces japonicus]|uniref:uncharacterized protein n=1 Tax=Lipomyces japonicus TaxID=56871 RepID=UPI0034CDBD48
MEITNHNKLTDIEDGTRGVPLATKLGGLGHNPQTLADYAWTMLQVVITIVGVVSVAIIVIFAAYKVIYHTGTLDVPLTTTLREIGQNPQRLADWTMFQVVITIVGVVAVGIIVIFAAYKVIAVAVVALAGTASVTSSLAQKPTGQKKGIYHRYTCGTFALQIGYRIFTKLETATWAVATTVCIATLVTWLASQISGKIVVETCLGGGALGMVASVIARWFVAYGTNAGWIVAGNLVSVANRSSSTKLYSDSYFNNSHFHMEE